MVKSLVTSQFFNGKVHVSYKNVETNPRISSMKIISNTQFCLSGRISDRNVVIGFHLNYAQVPIKDAKSKD